MTAKSIELELLESGADHPSMKTCTEIGAVSVQALFDGWGVAQITSYIGWVAVDLDLLTIPDPLVDCQMGFSSRNYGQLLATGCSRVIEDGSLALGGA